MKQSHKTVLGALVFLALTAFVIAALFSDRYTVSATHMPVKTTILKVGKADAIIVDAGDETLVIDTGEEEDGVELLEYLASEGIDHIDTLIITHYDKDHVGGADTVVETVPVGRILVPDYDSTSVEYLDFLVALEETGITPERLSETTTFSLGDAEVIVEPPLSYDIPDAAREAGVEYDNNFSLVTTIVHGNNRMVFAGDIEKQRIREWLDASEQAVPCTFLKVPHHGVFNTELENLFNTLQPSYAAICDSNKNPSAEDTVVLLKQLHTDVFQTKNGKILLVSDGAGLQIRQ
ncbi:MAG: MBL fold metallo-hydrolase [Lachnospiraceae bacterium]|nr:MBL fold metallo-hydrolase [Lachnospiraceae bacterium]